MIDQVSVVTTFLDALAAGDSRTAVDLLDSDVEWRNTGLPTLRGRRATGALLGMEKRRVGFGYEMHAVAVSADGDSVLTDRTDWITLGRFRTDFWVRGTFTLREGRILVWDDAFSMGSFATGSLRGLLRVVRPG
ncbi:limonene-1,2-epoxide hydrolase family protein [Nocardioides sp.]|uniref:limonene-1,2-epoxide hydrolase family protein n=1 Tax=Nocardioides sp. TaxID=35761 RepID=UPI00260392F7|nr:limonene-1,2-epoxide hydrolase family protein [Nocardioides sp.]